MDETMSAPAGEPGASAESQESPATTPEIRKHRVKVFDQELEVTEDEMKRDYELRRASHMRMQQAAEKEKALDARRKSYETDPWKIFEELKLDPDQLAEERLLRKLERDMMTPEQKKMWEREQSLTAREKEIQALEEEKKSRAEELAKQEQDQLTYKAIQEIDTEIGDVLKSSGLKPTPRIISRIAEVMLSHLDSNQDGERLSADRAYGLAREEMMSEMTEYLGGMSPEQLVETLPKPVLDALRKHDLEKARGTNPIKRNSSFERPTPSNAKGKKKTSTDNFFKKLDSKFN